MPALAERVKTGVSVVSFGIEADHPRNSDLLLQSVANLRLRSAFDASKPARSAKTGDTVIPIDQTRNLANFPRTPGMQLIVNPQELTYQVIDPLYGDDDLMEKVTRWFREHKAIRSDAKMKGVKPKKGKIDVHRMKTLCREMLQLVEAGEATLVKGKGPLPDLSDIEDLPGHFLLNPGSRVRNTQPRFEKDMEVWYEKVSMAGDPNN